MLFLEEVEELVGVVEPPAHLLKSLLRQVRLVCVLFPVLVFNLFSQLCLCCSSLHGRVAERSLRLLIRHRWARW